MKYLFSKKHLTEFLSHFNEEKRLRMVDVYVKGLNTHRASCVYAIKHKDADALHATAHDLKSLAYMMGAKDFGRAAENIEENVINKRSECVFEAAQALPDFIDHAVDIMEEYISETYQ